MLRFDEQLSAKVLKRVGQLRRLGARGVVRTAYVRMLGPTVYSLSEPGRKIAHTLHRQRSIGHAVPHRLQRLKERVPAEVRLEAAPLLLDIDPQAEARVAPKREAGLELKIGELGPDRTLLSDFGRIAGFTCVPNKDLSEATDRPDELVDVDGHLGIKTHFGKDEPRFVQALEAALDLCAAGCAVAPVIKVDWEEHAIISAYHSGVPIQDQLRSDARALLLDRIEGVLLSVHRAGYVLDEIHTNQFLCDPDDTVALGDVSHARPLAGLSRDMSIYVRDVDSRAVNELFGTTIITADLLRERAAPPTIDRPVKGGRSDEFYAPVVIRDDIRWGKIWNTDVGIGRWNFIMKDHLPIPPGGSVLDLGANNAFNPLQMLRAGAGSAVGIEIDERAIDQGMFLKSAYEWLDNRTYDFRYIQGSQADVATMSLPRFDVVTALCSLYYLRDQEIRGLVTYLKSLTDVLVLQCNTDRLIDRSDEETYHKASVSYALEVLEAAGFANREVIAPAGYSRPLVIGRA